MRNINYVALSVCRQYTCKPVALPEHGPNALPEHGPKTVPSSHSLHHDCGLPSAANKNSSSGGGNPLNWITWLPTCGGANFDPHVRV